MIFNGTNFILDELGGLWGQSVLEDVGNIIRLYEFYDGTGQDWPVASGLDYKPSKKRVNFVKKLIKREAGFMFGRSPELNIRSLSGDGSAAALAQNLLDGLLEKSSFKNKLIQAARDCFIGKRVALKLSCGFGRHPRISFRPSFEFVYSTSEDDCDSLDKIIFFYQVNDESDKRKQRIWKQKYFMRDGRCFLNEGVYNGFGELIEGGSDSDTGLDFIPCYVILNEGLTGDLKGESDVAELIDLQNSYNHLISDDADALKFNMFPQTVATDAKAESLEYIRLSPGALVDLQTDPAVMGDGQSRQARLQKLESGFGYSDRFEAAVNRTKNDMFDMLSVPNVSLEQLKGLMQSGKSMRALYWELISRCEEKWASWEPALIWLAKALIKMENVYLNAGISEDFSVSVEHIYPILEDDFTEMSNDRQEVAAGLRSRRNYIEKWDVAPDSLAELQLISQGS